MRLAAFALLAAFPCAAIAEPDYAALTTAQLGVLESQFGAFRDASATLRDAAAHYCETPNEGTGTVRAALESAWLAWAPLDSYQFGPMEQTGAALTVNFWPDKRGFVNAGVRQIYSLPEAEQSTVEGVAKISAGGQGFPALAEVLTNPDLPDCPAALGIASHIAFYGGALHTQWFGPEGWAEIVQTAGPDNPIYLSDAEFTAEIFTALNFGAERAGDYRIGRPMGEERGGMAHRVDGHRLGLGTALIDAQIAGMGEMIDRGFGPALSPEDHDALMDAIGDSRTRLDRIELPLADAVTDPEARWRVEAALNGIAVVKMQLALVAGPALGVQSGFSPADGD